MFLTVNRGDNITWTFLVLDDGDPADLSTIRRIRFTVKNKMDDADSDALIRLSDETSGVTVLTQSGDTLGQFEVSLTHADTKTLVTADYRCVFDCQITWNDGSVSTPFMGEFFIAGDVTHNSNTIATDV